MKAIVVLEVLFNIVANVVAKKSDRLLSRSQNCTVNDRKRGRSHYNYQRSTINYLHASNLLATID
ncbi:MAG: hypothetical protein HC894_20225 [Microcoleus sp. SM1_3_4]|nr:hypothetical protein [Microcoleus sp. SM1_3_4]